jgi:acetoin utilization protein AcuB
VKINDWMTRTVLTVKPLDPITRARQIMVESRVNQLPVMKNKRIVGIVTDRDLRDAFPSAFLSAWTSARPARKEQTLDPKDVTVEMVMTADVVTLGPEETLSTAADTMRRERIGAIPIVAGENLLGIITRADILRAFVSLAEAAENRSR